MNDRQDRTRIPRAVAGSIGTGLLAVLMAGVVAFGASTIRPMTAADADVTATQPADEHQVVSTGGHEGALAQDRRQRTGDKERPGERSAKPIPTEEPAPKDEPAPNDEPKDEPDPTAKPEPKPDPTAKPKPTDPPKENAGLALSAWVNDQGKVKLSWTTYGGDGFEYYKLVRSKDASVTWPTGEGDSLVAAIADRNAPLFYEQAPCGKELHYRVFAVRHAEGGYKVLAASNTVAAFVKCHQEPKPTNPPAEPQALGLEAWQVDGGLVKVAWSKCGADGFKVYKVVRSDSNEHPTYPLQGGDELIGAIGDRYQTHLADGDVQAGQTWFYRVLALGDGGAVLCHSDAVAVTVE